MKFLRTEDTVFEVVEETELVYRVKAKGNPHNIYSKSKKNTTVIKIGDTITDVCDEFIIKYKDEPKPRIQDLEAMVDILNENNITVPDHIAWLKKAYEDELEYIYLGIWTRNGLRYVANDKGELLWKQLSITQTQKYLKQKKNSYRVQTK